MSSKVVYAAKDRAEVSGCAVVRVTVVILSSAEEFVQVKVALCAGFAGVSTRSTKWVSTGT
jgi:hypothetical protein